MNTTYGADQINALESELRELRVAIANTDDGSKVTRLTIMAASRQSALDVLKGAGRPTLTLRYPAARWGSARGKAR